MNLLEMEKHSFNLIDRSLHEYLQNTTNIVESVLLEHISVEDCAVLIRETEISRPELVAYIVSQQPLESEQLQFHLQEVIPLPLLPKAYVQVSNLPLTPTGEVDKQALISLPVLDFQLAGQIEKQLQSKPEIEQLAVILQEDSLRLPRLHITDLLPERQRLNTPVIKQLISSDTELKTQLQSSQTKQLAISYGTSLPKESYIPSTLPEILQTAARQAKGERIIYLLPDGTELRQSYTDLLVQAQRILGGLRKLGLKPQDKVILQLELNYDILAAFWGCLLGGFIPLITEVPPTYKESNKGVDKLVHIWNFLDSPIILTTQAQQQEIEFLAQWLPAEKLKFAFIEALKNNFPDKSCYSSQSNDVAFFNLTSGSTGIPKCIQLTHRNLIANAIGENLLNQHDREDAILNWLPLDHIGGISMCHIRGVVLGCTLVYAQKEYVLGNILNWLDLIDKYRITHSWAPNFAYALINEALKRESSQNWDLSCVKFLVTGGEAVAPKTVETFLENTLAYGLKKTAIRAAFGMAEMASAITFYQPTERAPIKFHRLDKSCLQGTIRRVETEHPNSVAFTDLGAVIPGVTIRIVDSENNLVPEDTIGRFQVKGDAVSPGYYKNPQANSEAFLADGWFDTGDNGFIANGHLVLTGRAKETIIINGANYYSHEIEAIVEEIEQVEASYTAACAVKDADSVTEKLAIFFHSPLVEDEALQKLLQKIQQTVVNKVGLNPDYLILVAKEDIPKTAIGKIQRRQLSQRFQAGEFDTILKRLDILMGDRNTLPDWFYHKIWRSQKAIWQDWQPISGHTVVFLDSSGLGSILCQHLQSVNRSCIRVQIGQEFSSLGDNSYCINPQNPDHYQQLFRSILYDGQPVSEIIHLWTYDSLTADTPSLDALQPAQERGIYSLLYLIQALAKVQGSQQSVRLLCVGSQTQATSSTDKIAPAKSLILGLLKTIPQEMPTLRVRHVDLLLEEEENNAAYILQELQTNSKALEVAYRQRQRLVPRLQKVDWKQQLKGELPFKQGGIYLLSGGLGGVGAEIAKYLLQNYQAKLLLLGRSPLSEKIEVYRELEQLPGEISYQQVDICQYEQVQQALTQALSQWQGELAGIIHLAVVYGQNLLLEETRDNLEAVLRPKVQGTWVLHQLLQDYPNSLFISFSSLADLFGGANIGAYIAANSFLERFTHYQRHQQGRQSYCFVWGNWDNLGISQDNPAQSWLHRRGSCSISTTQGLYSLLTGLYHDQEHLLIGLDGSKPYIQKYLEIEASGLQKLTAYFTTKGIGATVSDLIVKIQNYGIVDYFGTPVTCDFVQLAQMPLTVTGEIDREQLQLLSAGRDTQTRIMPRNELERQISLVWQEVLGIGQIDIHSNFFELGGSSIKAIILVNKLEKQLGRNFHFTLMIEAPTIAQFSSYIQNNYLELNSRAQGSNVSTTNSKTTVLSGKNNVTPIAETLITVTTDIEEGEI
ncbi:MULTISPECIES: SDR family NAD(P)-dependent oxidoreductase [Nostocales]|uniref:SDR family NAD(P)-dependent oxidoreductase n=3 Tax=Nostocales TaxID=1161 RepID=A0A8S9SX58_9CYAN|nr:SDR family NAD(P)-dependent oxidoreductase [Tolypothrix bouteillei]KAF3884406.1 SDR family NAD(P)-dependent oxidoreductase [Tolypothrix bouteillei VB521301]